MSLPVSRTAKKIVRLEVNKNFLNTLTEKLTNADFLEVWFLNTKSRENRTDFESEYLDFEANEITKNIDINIKKKLILEFTNDVEKGGELSRCWIPHHGIKAIIGDEIIKIAICYMCGSFRGLIDEDDFFGTFPNEEESSSIKIFNKITKQ